jgi:uncharacterized protein
MLRSLLSFYKQTFSVLLGERCRFFPSCSNYAVEAIELHGFLKGGFLGFKRVCRCHPWSEGGFDYVPSQENDN